MVLKGNVAIHAPRKKVWDFLTDPNQIGQCVPGVEKIGIIEPNKKYRGALSMQIALPVMAEATAACRTRKPLPATSEPAKVFPQYLHGTNL